MVCMGKRIGEWEKPSIELPPGWWAAVEELSRRINRGRKGKMRFVWAVAADLVLSLSDDAVRRRVRELQLLDEDDQVELVKRHSDDAAYVARLAAQERPQSSRSSGHQTHRGAG